MTINEQVPHDEHARSLEQQLAAALMVFTRDLKISDWLEANDPQALRQATAALARYESEGADPKLGMYVRRTWDGRVMGWLRFDGIYWHAYDRDGAHVGYASQQDVAGKVIDAAFPDK